MRRLIAGLGHSWRLKLVGLVPERCEDLVPARAFVTGHATRQDEQGVDESQDSCLDSLKSGSLRQTLHLVPQHEFTRIGAEVDLRMHPVGHMTTSDVVLKQCKGHDEWH